MKKEFTAIVIQILIFPSVSLWSCTDPGCVTNITSCQDSFCQCNSDRIFNCTQTATTLSEGTYSFIVNQSAPSYFILNVPVDEEVEYYLRLTDYAHQNLLSAYRIEISIDQGTGQQKGSPSGYYSLSDHTAEFVLQFQLNKIGGTTITQRLVVNATYLSTGSSTLQIQFKEYGFNWTSLMMILAYVAGGLLLVATLIMLIIICRRNREEERVRRERRSVQERKSNDISHFNALMPISTVPIESIQDGMTCSVCLGQFDSSSLVRTTICGHIFHSTCIDEWCVKNLSCPICRTELSHQNVLQLRSNTDPSNDNSSWVVNTIDYSDEDDGPPSRRRPREQVEMEEVGDSRRDMRRPLREMLDNSRL